MTTEPMLRMLRTAIFVALISTLFSFSVTRAQSGVGVSPSRAEFHVQPGTEVTQGLVVDNPSGLTELAVVAALQDALMVADGQVTWLPPASHPNSAAP